MESSARPLAGCVGGEARGPPGHFTAFPTPATMAAEESSTVRLKVGKTAFELLVKPGSVEQYREGACSEADCLLSDQVFKAPSRKGEIASHAELVGAGRAGPWARRCTASGGT